MKRKMIRGQILTAVAGCALAAGLGLTGCSTVTVHTDYDHTAAFDQYHTYTLTSAKDGLTLAPSAEAALRDTLRAQFGRRGITEVANPPADLEIVQHVFTREGSSVQQYSTWGYGYGYGGSWPSRYGSYGMWAGAPVVYTDVRAYTVGTLVLDFVDAKSRKLVFRGTGEGFVDSPAANAKSVETAVEKIFRSFPRAATP